MYALNNNKKEKAFFFCFFVVCLLILSVTENRRASITALRGSYRRGQIKESAVSQRTRREFASSASRTNLGQNLEKQMLKKKTKWTYVTSYPVETDIDKKETLAAAAAAAFGALCGAYRSDVSEAGIRQSKAPRRSSSSSVTGLPSRPDALPNSLSPRGNRTDRTNAHSSACPRSRGDENAEKRIRRGRGAAVLRPAPARNIERRGKVVPKVGALRPVPSYTDPRRKTCAVPSDRSCSAFLQ